MSPLEELKSIKARKLVKTAIEYECRSNEQKEEVLNTVRDIITNQLNSFSKITYDLEGDNKVKVELFQHA